MGDEAQFQKIERLIDGLAEATLTGLDSLKAEMRAGFERLDGRIDELASETHTGFGRVERRLGHIETRIEGIETEFRSFRNETQQRLTSLEGHPN